MTLFMLVFGANVFMQSTAVCKVLPRSVGQHDLTKKVEISEVLGTDAVFQTRFETSIAYCINRCRKGIATKYSGGSDRSQFTAAKIVINLTTVGNLRVVAAARS